MMNPNELTCDDLGIGGFRLYQPKKGYRFSMDAPLLAALVPLGPRMTVLDFGCGSGVLPLLLLGREPSLQVSGIELRQRAFELAKKNMMANRVAVSLVHGDAMKADAYFPAASFDLIVSNPPYYPVGSGRLPQNEEVAAAKTELFWQPKVMMEQAFSLLKEDGRFALIFDGSRGEELLQLAVKSGFSPSVFRPIYGRVEDVVPKRVYLLLSKGASPFKEDAPLVIAENTGERIPEMKRIFDIYDGTGTVSCGDAHRESR